ncbi:MAG: tRNA (N(6)-L-threonylcarbamoyladenosine(37)-C(2))-methylthiotransferase MtaB [Bacteroidales bacterium]|nr:tRNA (N(6)-L-threonylcarbamoyladenosine(37)-C(2))-methylthiotransferase MtaB [Bacteroidales bacterium]
MNKQAAFITLGCKLNFAETSTFARQFARMGFEEVPAGPGVDVVVINTCSVTEHADKKCRNLIRRLHKLAPEAKIAVTGCYAQLKPEEILAIDGVDLVVGTDRKGDLVPLVMALFDAADDSGERRPQGYCCDIDAVKSFFPAYASGERTRSFLKVQDGCDYRCAYCTVPLARGHSRNLPIADLVAQAREIAAAGIVEVVLTGVNTGDFGKTTGESFLSLLQALEAVPGIERYRISSIEPNLLTEEILRWIATHPKFLPHFHIPIQSGCNKTLKEMHRRYTTEQFEAKIALIRDILEKPEEWYTHVFFGIDVIVGFPGETEEDFEETYRLMERVRPAFLHIFPYSRRAGTPAAERPDQVQDSVKTLRVQRLEALSDRLHAEFTAANTGREARVLFESTMKGGKMFGYTENYLRVERPYDKDLIGRIVEITI